MELEKEKRNRQCKLAMSKAFVISEEEGKALRVYKPIKSKVREPREPSISDIKVCLGVIITNREIPAVKGAIKYAFLGIKSKNKKSLRTYCIAVLENIDRWNGITAVTCRRIIRKYVNQDKELTKVNFIVMKDYKR